MVRKLLPVVLVVLAVSFVVFGQEKDKEPVKEMRVMKLGSTDSADPLGPTKFTNDNDKIKKLPKAKYPAEARTTGLAGIVRVPIRVSAKGEILEVGEPLGPGAVCDNSVRADVVAMRAIAKELAAKVVIDTSKLDAAVAEHRLTVGIEFVLPNDLKKKFSPGELIPVRIGSADDNSGAVTKLKEVDGERTASGGVLNGKATSLPKPVYPRAARSVRASGTVTVQVLIDTDGSIFEASAVAGHPLLRTNAVTAACGSKFLPTILSGQPVKVTGVIVYNFIP